MSPMVSVPMKNMKPLPQDTATTCWLTCFRMMFAWKDRDPAGIRPALEGAGILWDDACKTGLKTRDYMKAARALGMKAWGSGGSWSAASFASFCTASPVWVAGKWEDYPHNIVVTGASREQVRYIDPWWEGVKEATVATRFADDFIHGNRKDRPGTDYYIGKIGAVMVWDNARPDGIVPE
ncbi:hypothetical protein M0638_19860 [Roseomonas sp. NAR14]|uniref:Uncharacterized protein n=1 Tax=Roseomonas acroporae TaxID=2937791 RepID=A0A9X1YCT0_9PROT|nr:papain-like cysteine protease family protein [Roseomonas acroporae]MCK8786635.1 hypothetical protein [Roseomonas acroporae]